MARKRYSAEEIIGHLRTIEIELGKGLAVVEACRKLGITRDRPTTGGRKNIAGCGLIKPKG